VRGEGRGRDADAVVEIIRSRGGEAVADYGDVSKEPEAEAMVRRGIEEWGRLDIVVNNAGIVRDRSIWNMSADDFDLVMNVHVRGTWLTCRAAAQYWRSKAKEAGGAYHGRIINTTSGAGLLGNFGQTNYATAKAAIAGLTLTLAVELASIGVTANLISPGGLTRITATTGIGDPIEPDDFDAEAFDPMDPSNAAPIVAWLVSEEAQLVTGQCLRVVRDRLSWLKGWHEAAGLNSDGKRWKAEEVGRIVATDLFGVRAPGLRLGG
jgi:NAD(P)-dependent dehydrogenase (short-subunit alcohol dehydrogenase family)